MLNLLKSVFATKVVARIVDTARKCVEQVIQYVYKQIVGSDATTEASEDMLTEAACAVESTRAPLKDLIDRGLGWILTALKALAEFLAMASGYVDNHPTYQKA